MTPTAAAPGWLGIDLGTASVKAVVLTPDGAVRGESSAPVTVRSPLPGQAESDPGEWWEAVVAAVRGAAGALDPPVAGVGLSGQMHGVVLTGADGAPQRPAVLWLDSRATGCLHAWETLDGAMRRRLANPLVAGMAGPILRWLVEHEPAAVAGARWALQPKDWLRLRLVGDAASDPTDASATLLYDLPADRWALDVADAVGVPARLLAPLRPSEEPAGTLRADAADSLGLPAGVPVAVGAGDTAAGLLGSGWPLGGLQLTVGSGAQLVTLLDGPQVGTDPTTFCCRAVGAGRWYAMAAMQNAGRALEWMLETLGLSWEQAYEAAADVPAGSEGVRFLPYLAGERTPHFDGAARGAWVGLGLGHTRAHLARAALEGVAFAVRDGLEALETGTEGVLRLAGGGTDHPLWRQMLADVLDRPLTVLSHVGISARGAALLGGMAAGQLRMDALDPLLPTVRPGQEPGVDAPAYTKAYTGWRRLYPALRSGGP